VTGTDATGAPQQVSVTLADEGLLGRLYTTGCADQAIADGFDLTFAPTLTPTVVNGREALHGTLSAHRTASTRRLLVSEPGGNVIFDVTSPALPVIDLQPDQQDAEVTITLTPSRCDPHGPHREQADQPARLLRGRRGRRAPPAHRHPGRTPPAPQSSSSPPTPASASARPDMPGP